MSCVFSSKAFPLEKESFAIYMEGTTGTRVLFERSKGKEKMYKPRDMEAHVTFCAQSNRLLDRGVEGERRAVNYLFGNLQTAFVGNYHILVNYNFPLHGASTLEIDLLVVTRFGVFLLEVKNWRGRIIADDDAWYLNRDRRGNVFVSTTMKAKKLYSHLKSGVSGLSVEAHKISVTPHIVLVHGTQTFENRSNYDSRAVVGLDQNLLHTLSSTELLHRGEQSSRLTDNDIKLICDSLYLKHQIESEEIVDHYRLLKEIRGSDIFDEFDVEDTNTNIPYRLKCYHLHSISNERVTEKTIEQFRRSIQVVESLKHHPNIVQTKAYFPDPKYYDFYYEVTEAIDGERLDEVLELRHRKGKAFSLKEQIFILGAICKALQHAHNHKPDPVYHRNVSLETIFLIREGNKRVVKLADFDFAKYGPHTLNPMYWGDPAYRNRVLIDKVFTAPELLIDASNASAASDIYSLGIIWYFLVLLPEFDSTLHFNPQMDSPKIDILQLPEVATDLLKGMVAYDSKNRPHSVEEIFKTLKSLFSKE